MLGDLLRKTRRSNDFTIKDMAGFLDVTFQFVSLVEKGHRIPTPAILETWRKILHLPAERVQKALAATQRALAERKAAPPGSGRDLHT